MITAILLGFINKSIYIFYFSCTKSGEIICIGNNVMCMTTQAYFIKSKYNEKEDGKYYKIM